MNGSDSQTDQAGSRLAALFQTVVIQQVGMARMCLGQAPDESGQTRVDLDGARFFIDILEMLEAKTKGNLSRQEESLLKQSLTSLRLAFVEASNTAASKAAPAPAPRAETKPADSAPTSETAPAPEQPADAESRKKYSKKY